MAQRNLFDRYILLVHTAISRKDIRSTPTVSAITGTAVGRIRGLGTISDTQMDS